MQYYNPVLRSSLIKTAWVLFAAMFVATQGLAQAHSTAAGETDHSHDGVVCELCLAGLQQIATEPPLKILTPFVPPAEAAWDAMAPRDVPRTFDGRAPPPRGPPTR